MTEDPSLSPEIDPRVRLVEPGVVSCTRWWPGPGADGEPEVDEFCGIGRKPQAY